MSTQSSKTVIGGFVIGALVLAVAGVLVFGSGRFMKKTNKWTLFFEDSVKGLNVGSPVVFRGVKIGSVSDVSLWLDPKRATAQIPIIIETDPERIKVLGGREGLDSQKSIQGLIDSGLRGKLGMESMVTGQLMIEFAYYPDKPARFVGKNLKYPELPTIRSPMDEFVGKLKRLPIQDTFAKLNSTLTGIDRLVNSPKIMDIIDSAKLTVEDIRKLVEGVDAKISPLAASLENTVNDYGRLARNADSQIKPLTANIDGTLGEYKKLARDLDRQLDPLTKEIGKTAKSAAAAFKRADDTIKEIETMFSKKSVTRTEINQTLKQLSAAARSIRVWASYLERHPEALIRGKGGYRR